jgi:hypothetical protein
MQRQNLIHLNERTLLPPPQKKSRLCLLKPPLFVMLKLLHFTPGSVVSRVTIIIFVTKVTNLLRLSKAPGMIRFRLLPDLC